MHACALALTAQTWQPWWWRLHPGPAGLVGSPSWPAAAPGSADRTPAGPMPCCNTGTRSVTRGRGLSKAATHQYLRLLGDFCSYPAAHYLISPRVCAACTCLPSGDSTLSRSIWHRQYLALRAWFSYRMAFRTADIGWESGEHLKIQINKSKSQLLPRFRHSHIWGSPPSPSPQEADPPRWTQRRSTLRRAPAWQMRRLSPSWRSQCRRGSLPVPVSPRCRRHMEARHIQKWLLLEHGPRWVPQLRPAAAVLKTRLKGLVITLWDELEEKFNE